MASPKNLIGITVNEALTRFPDLPSATLAKKLFSDFPELFMSIENTRSVIRYYRGQIVLISLDMKMMIVQYL